MIWNLIFSKYWEWEEIAEKVTKPVCGLIKGGRVEKLLGKEAWAWAPPRMPQAANFNFLIITVII